MRVSRGPARHLLWCPPPDLIFSGDRQRSMNLFTSRRAFLTAGAALGATVAWRPAAQAFVPNLAYLWVNFVALDYQTAATERELYALMPDFHVTQRALID